MIDENLPQPDPAWDYYIRWHSLHHIKAKIDAALQIMSSSEEANSEVNDDIKRLLDPASDKLVEIVDSLTFDDDDTA
jgi:hypothetical protein